MVSTVVYECLLARQNHCHKYSYHVDKNGCATADPGFLKIIQSEKLKFIWSALMKLTFNLMTPNQFTNKH